MTYPIRTYRDSVLLYLYRMAMATLLPLVVLFVFPFQAKLRRILSARLRTPEAPEWAGLEPAIWIHAASGEFEYAKPLIRALKEKQPKFKIVVSYLSPTYAQNVENFPQVDFALPLPFDLPGPQKAWLKKIKPRAVLIARTDLWPEFLEQCAELEIPRFLFSATASPKEGRKSIGMNRWYRRWILSYLDEIWCVSSADQANLTPFADEKKINVLGDTRFDQVLDRLKNPRPLKDKLKPTLPALVAGSTWPEDEAQLLPKLAPLIQSGQLQLILAPHEPTATHLKNLESLIQSLGLKSERYSQTKAWQQVLIVDQVGILAELYTWGKVAFVGGSFRSSVHSVMEPLGAGLITLVGPFHQNNREAIEFSQIKGASEQTLVIPIHDQVDLKSVVLAAIDENNFVQNKNNLALQLENHRGATERVLRALFAKIT